MILTSSDLHLLQGFIAGDQEAFAVLVSRHQGLVRATCARQADSGWEDDCVQAVFLVLAKRPSAALRTGNLPGWLVRVAWFVCRRSRRAAVRRQHAERDAAQLHATVVTPIPSEPDALSYLDDCLQKLPSRQRAAVTLHYLTGHPAEEVAALLGVTRDNAYQLLSRGLAGLRLLLAQRGAALSATALVALLGGQAQAASAAGANSAGALATLTATLTATPSPTATTLANGAMTAMTIATSAPLALAASLLLAVGLTATALTAEHPRPSEMPMADSAPKNEASGTVGTAVGTTAGGRQTDDRAWRRDLENKLDQEITCDIQGRDLTETVSLLEQVIPGKFVLDPKVMAANPQPITLTVTRMKLRYAIDFIMRQNSLQYTLRDGAFYVTFADPDWHRKLENQLEQEITLDFENKDFGEVVSFLQKVTNANVVLDPRVMVADLPPITLQVERMKLEHLLDFILRQNSLRYSLRNEAIVITLADPARLALRGARKTRGVHLEDASVALQSILEQRVTAEFTDTPRNEVFNFLRKITGGMNLIISPEIAQHEANITLKVTDMQLKDVLSWLSELQALSISVENDALYVEVSAAQPDAPGVTK
jgi:RNA polymerase sigma-70 factor (ECF subfamily)